MNNNPLVSVIVPVYNTAHYLHRCLNSIINQSYNNIEIILIDDGSFDSSEKICDEFAKKYNNICVVHKINEGQAIARNIGLLEAKGEYITFVDSDDWIDRCMYSDMVSAARRHDADIVVCGRTHDDEEGKTIKDLFTFDIPFKMDKQEAIRRFLLYEGVDGASCDKLFSRKVLRGLTYPSGLICEDLPFVYNALKRSEVIYHIGKPYYHYTQRNNSTSHSRYTEKSFGMILYTKEIRDDVCLLYPKLKNQADYYYYFYVCIYLKMIQDNNLEDIYDVKISKEDSINIIVNRFLTTKDKLIMLLIKANLYTIVKKIIKRKKA